MPKRSYLLLLTAVVVVTSLPVQAQQNELRSLAAGLAEDIGLSSKKSIAIVDFVDLQGRPTELGRYLAEELSVALARAHRGFEVIDRTHLKEVLAENKLAVTGLIDPATARKLGQIVGADAIVTGSLTPFSERVRLTVKVITADTARIIAADATDLPRTSTISQLLGGFAEASMPVDNSTGNGFSSSSRPPIAPSPALPSNPIVIEQEFSYELLGCKGVATSVTCSFRITNRGQDRILMHSCAALGTQTKAFDNFGNESLASYCKISDKGGPNEFATAELISDVPVPASALFPKVSASASALSLVSIFGRWSDPKAFTGGTFFNVSFRNIPISR